jgi:hydrogenase nickel incorporation protein HypA/HybF
LIVEEVPVVVYCPGCRADRPLSSIQFFSCAECGAPASQIVQGKELEVVALEIEE